MAAFDMEEIVETGTGGQIDTTTSGSGMFSLFRRRPQADAFNHPCGIIGPLITRYGNGLSVLPNSPKEGWVSRLVHETREKFKIIA